MSTEKFEKKSKSSPKAKPTRSDTLTVKKSNPKKSPPKTKGGDVINLAPLISAVLLAAAKLSLEKKKPKSAASASASAKSRTRSR